MLLIGRALALAAVCAGAAACTQRPAAPGSPVADAPPLAAGTIVAIRPIMLLRPAGADVRASIFSAIGLAAAGGAPAAQSAEFIVREDGGRTVSVVQPGEPALLPGARVLLTGGDRVHLIAGAHPPSRT